MRGLEAGGAAPGARLAVWGDPIAHSKSPELHAAAYRVLDLDWDYGRRRVDEACFAAALGGLDQSWRGLSLTMPLKEEAYRASTFRDRHADATGAVNTLLLGDRPAGFNTDVGGIVDALAEGGVSAVGTARILGAGATAASALVALVEIGAPRIEVRARRPQRAVDLARRGERLGVAVDAVAMDSVVAPVDLTIATLPSPTSLPRDIVAPLAESGGVLFDAAYAPWPSALASAWSGAPALSGLGMLLHQAVRQIRIFLQGDPTATLPDEPAVVAAVRTVLSG